MSDKKDAKIAKLEAETKELKKQLKAAKAFKTFVHKSLDDYGVPADPEPEETAKHGCRISGRLNWLYDEINNLNVAIQHGFL